MSSSTESLSSQPPNQAFTPLESLVSHLIGAKRSLSSINHVYRANELVTSTRKSLETNVITFARTDFLRKGIQSQVKILSRVRNNTEGIANEGAAEFKAVILKLDSADERLRETLNLLRATLVEASLRPEEEKRRNLLDFVDEGGVESLMDAIKGSIDSASAAHDDFREVNSAFDEDLQRVQNLLQLQQQQKTDNNMAYSVLLPGSGEAEEGAGAPRSPIPEILQFMEEHAKDMADNLESLVTHFDLCVTAIKHTEGGGAAAQRIVGELEGVVVEDIGQASASSGAAAAAADGTPPSPISVEEKEEMMEVLEKDASQVEDVVNEIKERISEMEVQYDLVTAYMDQLTEEYNNTMSAFSLLEDIGLRLPTYITQSHLFVMRWDEEKAMIEEQMEELESLRDFYDGFLLAYDNLLIEIGRRKTFELKMERLAQDALAKIQSLYEDDLDERATFKQQKGDFLPADIWPGLTAGPIRYEIVPVRDGAEKVPDVSKSIIQRATSRVRNRDHQKSSKG